VGTGATVDRGLSDYSKTDLFNGIALILSFREGRVRTLQTS